MVDNAARGSGVPVKWNKDKHRNVTALPDLVPLFFSFSEWRGYRALVSCSSLGRAGLARLQQEGLRVRNSDGKWVDLGMTQNDKQVASAARRFGRPRGCRNAIP